MKIKIKETVSPHHFWYKPGEIYEAENRIDHYYAEKGHIALENADPIQEMVSWTGPDGYVYTWKNLPPVPGYYSATSKELESMSGVTTEVEKQLKYKDTQTLIAEECDNLKELLQSKNRKYGDSAISKGIAFNISPVTAIKARINDKLSRLKADEKDEDEDVVLDLLGYFILLRIAKKKEKESLNDLP